MAEANLNQSEYSWGHLLTSCISPTRRRTRVAENIRRDLRRMHPGRVWSVEYLVAEHAPFRADCHVVPGKGESPPNQGDSEHREPRLRAPRRRVTERKDPKGRRLRRPRSRGGY